MDSKADHSLPTAAQTATYHPRDALLKALIYLDQEQEQARYMSLWEFNLAGGLLAII